uniref:Glycosyl transferase CAP10 domain-containing protein n=2 Tax=Brassica oleracea TaxID=3712 RepID=A0A0D3BQ73_BRAOL|nr:unnamed protein product [Brassica oleracea]
MTGAKLIQVWPLEDETRFMKTRKDNLRSRLLRMYHPVPDLELFIQCHDIPQIWRRDYRPRRGVNVLQSSITVAMTVL